MKRILPVLMVLAFAVAPLVALAAPKLPFESVTSQSRNYGGQSDGLCFVGVVTGVPGAASTTNDDSLIISTWKWRGSLIDPDSVGRNAFDWPSGTNGDDAFVGGQWYLTVTQTADNAAPVGEFSPITAWDASTGQVVVSPAFSAVVAVGEHVAIVHKSMIPRAGNLSKTFTAATGADTTTLFTAVGNVWLTGLSSEITTEWASTADSVMFVYDGLVTAARIDRGEEWNAAAVGTIFAVNSATLGTATLKLVKIPGPNTYFRLLIPDGRTIRVSTAGNATTGGATAYATWEAFETGSYLRK